MIYKSDLPQNTIERIRSILKGLNIFVTEQDFQCHNKVIYSCRTIINNNKFWSHDIGSNGKGNSPEYTLASSYAELMERIQSGFTFRKNEVRQLLWSIKDKKNNYRFLNDGIFVHNDLSKPLFLSKNDLLIVTNLVFKKNQNILSSLCQNNSDQLPILNTFAYSNKVICSQFFNLNTDSIFYLPTEIIDFVCGTNGLCAGNTMEEAIGQGLYEVMERYSMRLLFEGKVTPPEIPIEFFKNSTVYNYLISLGEEYKVIIKDASQGMKLPVICLVLINTQNATYGISMGAHSCPNIALERCVNELHQGGIKGWFRELNLFDRKANKHDFMNQFKTASGNLPSSFFRKDHSYNFDEKIYWEANNIKDDTKTMIDLLINMNQQIFIQDLSFLGFPSFRVYIPGMSEINPLNFKSRKISESISKLRPDLSKIKYLNKSSIKKLLQELELIGKLREDFYKNHLFYNSNKELGELKYSLMLALLYYKVNNYSKAYFYFLQFYNYLNNENIYFKIVKDFLKLRQKNYQLNEIKDFLSQYYNKDTLKEVIDDLYDSNRVFNYFSLPNCFQCDKCITKEYCILNSLIQMNDILNQNYNQFNPDYKKISSLH